MTSAELRRPALAHSRERPVPFMSGLIRGSMIKGGVLAGVPVLVGFVALFEGLRAQSTSTPNRNTWNHRGTSLCFGNN